MLALPAFLLLLQPAPAAAAPEPYRDPVDLFMRICTEGGGGFAPGSIETIPAIDVAGVRDRVGQQRHNLFYRVRSGPWQAFLALQDTIAEADPRNTRTCSVASRDVDFRKAVQGIFPGRKPRGDRRSRSGSVYRHLSPDGHRVDIERLRDGYVLLTAIVPGPDSIRDEDILVAFRDACDRSHGAYALAAKGVELGWEEAPGGAHPSLPRLIAAAAAGGEGLTARAFRRTIRDRPVFAVVAQAADGSAGPGSGCRVYDFGAAGPVDPGVIDRWMQSEPAAVPESPEGGIGRLLRPNWDKQSSVQLLHVAPDSALAQQHGFSGNLFAAWAVGDP